MLWRWAGTAADWVTYLWGKSREVHDSWTRIPTFLLFRWSTDWCKCDGKKAGAASSLGKSGFSTEEGMLRLEELIYITGVGFKCKRTMGMFIQEFCAVVFLHESQSRGVKHKAHGPGSALQSLQSGPLWKMKEGINLLQWRLHDHSFCTKVNKS